MLKRKFRSIAALTSAVLFINAGICTFTATAVETTSPVIESTENISDEIYFATLSGVFSTEVGAYAGTELVGYTLDRFYEIGESPIEFQIEDETVAEITQIQGTIVNIKGISTGETTLTANLPNGKTLSIEVIVSEPICTTTTAIFCPYPTLTTTSVVEENTTLKEFFVYVGTYGDGLPQFRYLHQKSDGSYTADKVIWENAPTDIAYGDIFVADGEINLTKVYPAADNPVYAHAYHYTVDEDAVLNSFGKCTDIMEKKNLTVTSTTYDGSSHWSIRYKDDNDKEYYYGLSVLASNLEVDPLDCEVGDVYTFALYNDYMVIPLSEHNIEENAVMTVEITEIDGDTLFVRQSGNSGDLMTLSVKYLDSNIQLTVGMKLEVTYSGGILETYPAQFGNIKKVSAISDYTSVAGDANGDGEFTIADMVVVQKSIMGRKTAILSDCKAADLYEDGKIDVYDFILMRKNIIEKSK